MSLLEELRDCAGEFSPRAQLLLVGVLQEIDRLDGELHALADVLIGDRRYSISGGCNEHDAHAGPDGRVPGPTRTAAVADNYARL